MTRQGEDAARVFNVVVGAEPRDPVSVARPPLDYSKGLERNALRGATIGILRQAYERSTTDSETVRLFDAAVDDLRRAGARIVDPLKVEGLEGLRPGGACPGFKYDLNAFLAARPAQVPVKDLAAVLESGQYHPNNSRRLETAEKGPANGPESPACDANRAYRQQVRVAVLKTMDSLGLDAMIYRAWSNPSRLIGDLNTPHGDSSRFFSPTTGFPAVNVPMGYIRGQTFRSG